ncbi:MAG: SGNH/GDSL hydrolase family protein [Clostridiales bacterium]|nr:SGNH/GDSL hydrolase family protein [Clostridiales bacterium]
MNKKHILCYGDSNTWGYCAQTGGRYDDDVRWTCRLQDLLGEGYLVGEAGMSGRTTVFEDPLNEGLNGLTHLIPAMNHHCPLDLLVIMLGTNDTKERFSATPRNITDGLRRLVNKAKGMELLFNGKPRILIVAPMKIDERLYGEAAVFPGMGAGCVEKSQALPALYEALAQELGCFYMDCNPHVSPALGDFMHFDLDSNQRFAKALQQKVLEILG